MEKKIFRVITGTFAYPLLTGHFCAFLCKIICLLPCVYAPVFMHTVRFEPDALRRSGIFPCIIHWNFNHFVVLNGFKGNKACLNDPARGNYTVSMETFDKSFTGA